MHFLVDSVALSGMKSPTGETIKKSISRVDDASYAGDALKCSTVEIQSDNSGNDNQQWQNDLDHGSQQDGTWL